MAVNYLRWVHKTSRNWSWRWSGWTIRAWRADLPSNWPDSSSPSSRTDPTHMPTHRSCACFSPTDPPNHYRKPLLSKCVRCSRCPRKYQRRIWLCFWEAGWPPCPRLLCRAHQSNWWISYWCPNHRANPLRPAEQIQLLFVLSDPWGFCDYQGAKNSLQIAAEQGYYYWEGRSVA